MTNLPAPHDIVRMTCLPREHQRWSFWDPKYHLWRATEDDPDSDLYATSRDADAVIEYMATHS